MPSDELIVLCEGSPSLPDLRDCLGLDFRRFNQGLTALDPPRPPLRHPERHEEAFARFVAGKRGSIADRLRERYLTIALSGGDLAEYGEARNLADLTPDPAWLDEYATPPGAAMAERVRGWLAERGADPDLERTTDLPSVEEARRVNFEKLRRVVARADLVTRTWCHRAGVPRAVAWDSAPSSRVRSALETSFAGDFVELTGDEDRLMEAISEIRQFALGRGGSAVVRGAPLPIKQAVEVWGPVGDALPLMRRVKEQFDPDGIMSPGRFVGGI